MKLTIEVDTWYLTIDSAVSVRIDDQRVDVDRETKVDIMNALIDAGLDRNRAMDEMLDK